MYIVIAGGGKVGEYLATVLLLNKNEVAIIEKKTATADRLSILLEGSYLVINGDGCDMRYQEDSGIKHADVFVATTGQDDDNLVACMIAQRIFKVPRCIGRVNNPKNMRIFRKLGMESVSSTELIANLIQEEAVLGSASTAYALSHGNVLITEVVVPKKHRLENGSGIKVRDVAMPPQSLIAAVSSKDDTEVVNDETVLFPGDKAIVIADEEMLEDVRAVFKAL